MIASLLVFLVASYSEADELLNVNSSPQTASSSVDAVQTATSTTATADPAGPAAAPDPSMATSTPAAETATSSPAAENPVTAPDSSTAAAGDPAAANSDTGSGSTNNSSTASNNNTDITNNNNALTTNLSFIKADTGNNQTSYNTGSGIITTEKAKGSGEIINVINKNLVNVTGTEVPINSANSDTGASSTNQALVNINNQLTVKNVNNSNTVNELDAYVNSGRNTSGWNTGHGIILTGDADLSVNFATLANTNLVGSQKFYADWQNVYNNWTGDVDLGKESVSNPSPLSNMLINASNSCTGAGSTNQAIANVNDQVSIINQNSGSLKNMVKAEVTSGLNRSNENTGSGSVTSGDVHSSVNMVNFLNSNIVSSNWILKSLNVFGDWNGNIILPRLTMPNLSLGSGGSASSNASTGAGSDNSVASSDTSSTTIANTNRSVITNDINLVTDTGDNKTSYNGGTGVVQFGKADAETNEINVADLNVTGDSWWMVIVNKFGGWNGTTVGSPAGTTVNGSNNTVILTPENSGIRVANSSTGPQSNNDAGVNMNHSTDINNQNDADISNALDIKAISGQNEAQFNTGSGYIDTGDIKAANNIINFANANINVGNWMVAVVNVFGNWAGNLIFDNSGTASSTSPTSGTSLSSNTDTGAGSTNDASSTTSVNTGITNNNDAQTANNTGASSVSGENSASYNTGSGIVSTGGANTTNNVANQVNTNDITVGAGSGGAGTSGNSATGAGSTNDSTSSTANNNLITNNNNGTTSNDILIQNNTGQNSSNYNTGTGVVDTSWANTYLQTYNQQNDNHITMGQLVDDLNSAAASSTASTTDSNAGGSNAGGTAGSGNDNSTTTPSSTDTGSAPSSAGNDDRGGSGAVVPPQGGSSPSGNYHPSNAVPAELGNQKVKDASTKKAAVKERNKADFNNDGKVDDLDLSIMMANFGKKIKNNIYNVDTNGDGVVDDYDLSVFMANWGKALSSLWKKIV